MAAAAAPPQQKEVGKLQIFGLKLVCAGIAGAIGATAVYPLDMAKTRLQAAKAGEYSSFVDCLKKMKAAEGVAGWYKGLPVNLIGILPEKAIKLGVNDFLRDMWADEQGNVPFFWGAAAGGTAGLCQFVATNPMEITKIRMQTAAKEGRVLSMRGAYHEVTAGVGWKGLYKGTPATLMRDIPFSIVFFALYGKLKDEWATDANGKTNFGKVLLSGGAAGAVAAAMATPADYIKTNLQKKDAVYSTIRAQAAASFKAHGIMGFFAGVGPRCLIVGPLFAITLASYEVQKAVMVHLGWTPQQRR